MKIGTRMRAVIMLAFAVSASAVAQEPVPAKLSSPFEQAAVAREKALIEAKKKDDASVLRQIVSDDFSLVGVDGKLLQREEAMGDLGDSELVELTPYDMKVVSLGDAAAIVTYDAIFRKKPEEDQGPPPRYQHFSSVWEKLGNAWKLKFQQATAAHWGDW